MSYNKTKMRGDIFCMGRMIIAPENLAFTSKSTGYKDEALVFTRMNGSNFNRYFDNETFNSNNFFSRLKTLLGLTVINGTKTQAALITTHTKQQALTDLNTKENMWVLILTDILILTVLRITVKSQAF